VVVLKWYNHKIQRKRYADKSVILRITAYTVCTLLVVVLLCIFIIKPYNIFRYRTDASDITPQVTTGEASDTTEQTRRFINRFYQYGLQRAPTDDEMEQWMSDIENGETGDDVVRTFFLSDELTNPSVNNEEYIASLYHCMFGRDPDAAGYDNWVNELNNGMSRNTVVDTLLESELGHKLGLVLPWHR